MATIDLSLAPFAAGKTVDDGQRPLSEVFADAWESSLEAVEKLVAGAIYAGVAVLWLAIPVGLVLLGARRLLKRDHGGASAV